MPAPAHFRCKQNVFAIHDQIKIYRASVLIVPGTRLDIKLYNCGVLGKTDAQTISAELQLTTTANCTNDEGDDRRIQFIWSDGITTVVHTYQLHRFMRYKQPAFTWFHKLFSKEHNEVESKLIKCKVLWQLFDDESIAKKQMKMEAYFAPASRRRSEQHECREKKFLLSAQAWTDCFSELLQLRSMRRYTERLPTIDCFPCSDGKHQKQCSMWIKDNFFNSRYNAVQYWRDKIAFAYPQQRRLIIFKTLRAFYDREIRGYICCSRWRVRSKVDEKYEYLRKLKRACVDYVVQEEVVRIKNSVMDVIVYFLDCTHSREAKEARPEEHRRVETQQKQEPKRIDMMRSAGKRYG